MKKKSDSLFYVIALAGIIVVGIITTSIISAVKNTQGGIDLRAKAGVANTLKFSGVVASANDVEGVLIVDNVELSNDSRSGKPVNYGTWSVTPPPSFNLFSAPVGTTISFTVNTASFNVATKQVSAVHVTLVK